jgi:hypothetical protein
MIEETQWHKHTSDGMPVHRDTIVRIKISVDGEVREREGEDSAAWFDELNWWQQRRRVHITEYRVMTNT